LIGENEIVKVRTVIAPRVELAIEYAWRMRHRQMQEDEADA